MRILNPGRLSEARGFTLIEIIMVMAVIGVVLGLVLFRLPENLSPQTSEKIGKEIISLFHLYLWKAYQENTDYYFFVQGEREFGIRKGESFLIRRRLPEEITLKLEKEGEKVEEVCIGKTGYIEPFKLWITSSGTKYLVIPESLSGEIKLTKKRG